jgi:hypothetical protein
MALMAKKAAKRGPAKSDAVMVPRTFKVSAAYAEWLDRFAAAERVNLSSLIDRALASHAAAAGFETPPERTP